MNLSPSSRSCSLSVWSLNVIDVVVYVFRIFRDLAYTILNFAAEACTHEATSTGRTPFYCRTGRYTRHVLTRNLLQAREIVPKHNRAERLRRDQQRVLRVAMQIGHSRFSIFAYSFSQRKVHIRSCSGTVSEALDSSVFSPVLLLQSKKKPGHLFGRTCSLSLRTFIPDSTVPRRSLSFCGDISVFLAITIAHLS